MDYSIALHSKSFGSGTSLPKVVQSASYHLSSGSINAPGVVHPRIDVLVNDPPKLGFVSSAVAHNATKIA